MSADVLIDLTGYDHYAPNVPCPRCSSKHRTWLTVTRCLYPRTPDIQGRLGPFVAVHQMSNGGGPIYPALWLYPVLEQARQALRDGHPGGLPCCGSCADAMHRSSYPTLYVKRIGEPIYGASPLAVWR